MTRTATATRTRSNKDNADTTPAPEVTDTETATPADSLPTTEQEPGTEVAVVEPAPDAEETTSLFGPDIEAAMSAVVLREGHGNPELGKFLKAFRAVNKVSQVELAKAKDLEGVKPTTHCQIASLEQGGLKKGATPETLLLLAAATGVDVEVFKQMNERDLLSRTPAEQEVAEETEATEHEKVEATASA